MAGPSRTLRGRFRQQNAWPELGREQTVWFKVLQGRSSYSRLVATDLREHNDSNILEISIDFVRTKSISKFIERCRA